MATIKNSGGRILVLSLALATLFAGCMPRGQRALREGRELIEQGRYAEAIEELKLATSLIGTNAQAWNYLGLAYHHAGQTANAVQAYQTALARYQDLMEAHFNLGCLWLEQNRLDDARSELTTYTLRRGNSAQGWLKLGTAQLRSRDFPAAEKSFNEALTLSPQNPEGLNGLGLIQLQRYRSPRDAAQFFNNALKQQPDYAPALLNLAIVSHLYLNNHPVALQKYRAYLAAPGSGTGREEVNATVHALEQELGVAARPVATNSTPQVNAKGPEAKAASNVVNRTAVNSKPEVAANTAKAASSASGLSNAPTLAPQPAKAVSSVASPPPATRSQPSNAVVMASNAAGRAAQPEARERVFPVNAKPALAATNSPRVEAPNALSAQAIASGPNVPRYRYLSPSAPEPGDHSAAMTTFAQARQAQEAGRLSEAIQVYRRAAQQDPAYYDAYYNLGLAATGAGNLPQALAAYETALAIRSESLDARYNFALVLKQANFFVDAANELEKILSAYPNELRAHLALGNLYAQQLRQPAKAREHYVKVLQIDPRIAQASAIRYWLTANPQ